MSRRGIEEPSLDEHGEESHPAFGTAVVVRGHGSSRALFQSDLLHHDTVTLTVHRATRRRELNHDWVHPRDELVEIEMSLAQWGALVSSVGLGSGVPVTIRRTESTTFVPEIPHQPRTAESLREVKTVTDRVYDRVRERLAALKLVIDEKRGVRAVREALSALEHAVAGAGNTAQFAVDSLAEAGEKLVSQARADIEAHILEATRLTGTQASVEAPAFKQAQPAALPDVSVERTPDPDPAPQTESLPADE